MHIESDYSKIDKRSWYSFVHKHPNGNIFQTPEIVEVYKKTKNYKPIVQFAINDDRIIGVLVGVIQKEYSGFLGFFSSRCIISGGPLVEDNNDAIIEVLLKAHNRLIKGEAIYTQFRNLFDIREYNNIFKKFEYEYEPHLDIYIDLEGDKEVFWQNLKSKLRQNIRKSEKKGIVFKEIDNMNEIKRSYLILKEVYSYAKLPLPDLSLFENAFTILKNKNMAMFFKAEKDNEIMGIRFVLLFKNQIYDWYAGSFSKFYKYKINDYLPYKVIEWGFNQQEYTLFDFGGAGKPDIPYGVRDHKLKFSDNLINLGRFNKIHSPYLYKLALIGFKIWKRLKKWV